MTPRLPCAEFPTSGCVNRADIYYPENRGAWPTIVTLHGRPRTPADMAELARALAKEGAVVFNIDYRGVRPVSRGFPDSVTDVACAVRFAREKTARYGGDPDHVVVVGHSQGGYVGAMVSLFGDTFPGQAGDCFASRRTSTLPDGFAHLAGVTLNDRDHPVNIIFFGGTFAAIPEVWLRGDIYHRLQGRQRNRDLRVQIVFEMNDPILSDPHATLFQAALRREGYRSKLALLPIGSTHFDILDLDTAIGRTAFRLVERLIERTRPR